MWVARRHGGYKLRELAEKAGGGGLHGNFNGIKTDLRTDEE
jgi:hypothetical protein